MWVATFSQDTNIKGVGTMTATEGVFVYSRRVNTLTLPDVVAFVNEAKAAFSAKQTDATERNAVADLVTTRLNS